MKKVLLKYTVRLTTLIIQNLQWPFNNNEAKRLCRKVACHSS